MAMYLRFNLYTKEERGAALELRDDIVTALAALGIELDSTVNGTNIYLRHTRAGEHLHSVGGPAGCETCAEIRVAAIHETTRESGAVREVNDTADKLTRVEAAYRREFPNGRLGPPREGDPS